MGQQVIAPTPRPRAVSRPRPILNERTRSNRRDPARDFIARRGRRVKVVKGRKRPSASPKPQPIVRPKSQPLPTPVPTVAPVAAPVQPVALAAAFAAHPFISQYNSNNGIFSYSY